MSEPRGTTNSNVRGNTRDREARRAFLLRKFGDGTTCPCYRCGIRLTSSTVTVDRIIPGVDGGKYVRANIRPACLACNTETGSVLATRNRRRQHTCIDCLALPELQRPKSVRKIAEGCGPRSQRCVTHQRIHVKAKKIRASITYVAKTYGISEQEQAELWTFQGKACPCGRQPRRRPDTDHDHACCAGPTSCGQCVRGMCCRACNKDVLARYNATQLRALADYLDDPPMARMRRTQLKEAS